MSAPFNPFVIPFCAGMVILPVLLFRNYYKWLGNLQKDDYNKIRRNILSIHSLKALKEIFLECLIHRRIFKVNPLLGYMHMSLAFGWFLLIVVGKLQTLYYTHDLANEIYYPIFFRYFEQSPHETFFLQSLNAAMDFLLFFILTGICIAVAKRFYSRITGLRKITKHSTPDRLSLTFLWMIFPLRLLAESSTASFSGNGSFLTQPVGEFMAEIMPAKELQPVFWWLYSITVGSFLVTIPFSRYMHIPTEVLLIFLRNYGIKTRETYSGFSEFELQSCSRCGICIDSCQMNGYKKSGTAQMVYFLRKLRDKQLVPELTENCMMCGRCNEVCPVGIDLTLQRFVQRKNHSDKFPYNFSYLPEPKAGSTDLIYFAGCMSHLTPSIIHSMKMIFRAAGLNYLFLDEKGGVCCGRPLRLSGQIEAAGKLMAYNRDRILASGAKTLVTSCPICYKSFKEEYQLPIRVLHHSEFIPEIIRKRKLAMRSSGERIVYHDPCELGRGSGIYEQPRMLLQKFTTLLYSGDEREKSLCCGGSIGNLSIPPDEKENIQINTAEMLGKSDPDCIATACPMCKKSLGQFSSKPVKDIAEIVSANLKADKLIKKTKKLKDQIPTVLEI